MFIDDEPSKAFRNSRFNSFFIESFIGHKLSKNKVQWLDLAFQLWPTLIGLPFASSIGMHFETIVKYSKPCLSSYLPHYCWFMQYMKNSKGDCRITQLPLGMIHFEPNQLFLKLFRLCFHHVSMWRIQLLSFVCNGFGVLFVICAMMFVTLKSQAWCCPIIFMFQNNDQHF